MLALLTVVHRSRQGAADDAHGSFPDVDCFKMFDCLHGKNLIKDLGL